MKTKFGSLAKDSAFFNRVMAHPTKTPVSTLVPVRIRNGLFTLRLLFVDVIAEIYNAGCLETKVILEENKR